MDYDKLIEQLRWWADHCDRTNHGCHVRPFLLDAATAIETLRADLARVTAERDAAVSDINEILPQDELCPLLCEWCAWHDDCDGKKAPKWRSIKEG